MQKPSKSCFPENPQSRQTSCYGFDVRGTCEVARRGRAVRAEVVAVFAKRMCIAGLVLFAILNLTDYVQTYALLTVTGGRVYEANPLANAFLDGLGWPGLAVYKAATVGMVIASVILLLRRRPSAGVGVVVAGCLTLTAVTLYSHGLVARAEPVEALKEYSYRRVVPAHARLQPPPAIPRSQGIEFPPVAE
jgi:hypothetical protein